MSNRDPEMLQAEIDVLRGAGCREKKAGEPRSGPCGACLNCREERGRRQGLIDAARACRDVQRRDLTIENVLGALSAQMCAQNIAMLAKPSIQLHELGAGPDPDPTSSEPLYYIQETESSRDFALWWGPERCGYTTSLSDAGRYTEKEAMEIARLRGTDVPRLVSEVDKIASRTVHMDRMWDAFRKEPK